MNSKKAGRAGIIFACLAMGLVAAISSPSYAQPSELDPSAGEQETGGELDPPPAEEDYDPWEGIDRSGRIRKYMKKKSFYICSYFF